MRDEEEQSCRYITLRDNTRMRIRNKPAFLRHCYYTLNSDREGFYYNLVVCHKPFRNESQLIIECETAECCFLRRRSELRPLLHNVSAESFVHCEQVIQQALIQAVTFNVVNKAGDEPAEPINIYAEDQIDYVNHDDYIEEVDPTLMPDDVFLNGIRSLNIQQKD